MDRKIVFINTPTNLQRSLQDLHSQFSEVCFEFKLERTNLSSWPSITEIEFSSNKLQFSNLSHLSQSDKKRRLTPLWLSICPYLYELPEHFEYKPLLLQQSVSSSDSSFAQLSGWQQWIDSDLSFANWSQSLLAPSIEKKRLGVFHWSLNSLEPPYQQAEGTHSICGLSARDLFLFNKNYVTFMSDLRFLCL